MTTPLSEVLRDSASGPIGEWLRKIHDEQHRRNEARRARVLKYDDLRQALTEPPLSFRRAEQWTGYVPPKHDPYEPGEVAHNRAGKPNRKHKRAKQSGLNESPARTTLIVICREAYEREVAAGRTPADEPDLLALFPFPYPGLQRGANYEPAAEPTLDEPLDDEPASEYNPDSQHSPMRGPGRQ